MKDTKRRNFLKKSSLGVSALSAGAWESLAGIDTDKLPADFLLALNLAGNARDEQERFRLLKLASEQPNVNEEVGQHLQKLLKVADLWANGKEHTHLYDTRTRLAENGYLCGFFFKKMDLKEFIVPPVSEDSPLYPLCCLYRGRMLIWSAIQNRAPREGFQEEGRRLLEIAHKAYPYNPVIGMYLDQPILWPVTYEKQEQAPTWANLQREVLEKLTDVIHWWIDNRQLPDGQYGGGWGDDCEMWRVWTPILFGFEDQKIAQAQERLSHGMFSLKMMEEGYTSIMDDVEHTAENTADTITPMMHLQPDDPVWQQRALRLAELAREVWMGRNERGFLQFKSTFFTSDQVDLHPARACDTVYHPRALQPALLYWQRTGDQALGNLFTDWMKTWVDAAERSERGKPAGILPSAIHWPDGRVGGVGKNWWQPENYYNDLYTWPSAINMINDTLLLCYHMTGDETYLKPIRSMAHIWRSQQLPDNTKKAAPGSLAWCARQMQFLAEPLSKYSTLTGDRQFDDLLLTESDGYLNYLITEDPHQLMAGLEKNAEALRYNYEVYTSEVRFTDRINRFADAYLNRFSSVELPRIDPSFLYAMVSGNVGSALYFPMSGVRWLTNSREIALLVKVNNRDRFVAELYHFGPYPRQMGAELLMLNPGSYQMNLNANQEPDSRRIEVKKRTKIAFTLPPRQLCRLEIQQ